MNKAQKTIVQYNAVIADCKDVFIKKTKDYGTAWRILRLTSLTDQMFIKANRIRTIQEIGVQKVDDSAANEFKGIINYSIMALMQLELPSTTDIENINVDVKKVENYYDAHVKTTRELMEAKNHDYGEVWRNMRVSSITDLILMKLLRIKQIEDNNGQTLISEGLDANYQDIINYSIFALILIEQ